MSGWIKFDKDMANDPRLFHAATSLLRTYLIAKRTPHGGDDLSVTDASRFVTHALRGALVTLWCYADEHIRDDDSLPCDVTCLDAIVGFEGFCDSIPDQWLMVREDGLVVLPGYCSKNAIVSKRKSADTSAERTRRWRERKRDGSGDVSSTSQTRHSDVSKSVDQDLDQDLLGRRKEPPVSPKSTGKKPKRTTAKVPLPEDFGLTPDRAAYARQNLPGVDVDEAMAVFQTTWRSRGDRYADWDQHWQNCVRQWRANSGHWTAGKYPRLPHGPNGTSQEPDPWTVPA